MNFKWIFTMAWRDSRSQFKKLLLYVSSIVLGTAALVSIRSISKNLESAIQLQAKSLLGADLRVSSRKAFTTTSDSLFNTISVDQSRVYQFASMVLYEKTGMTRFSSIRAIEGKFPYYGSIITKPETADRSFRISQETIIDESLAFQFGINTGDSIKVGDIHFKVAGIIQKIPGESFAVASAAPRVYIPMAYLEKTKLIKPGSIVNHNAYFKLKSTDNVKEIVEKNKSFFKQENQRSTTVAQQEGQISRSMNNLYRFLNLIGFIALILGSIGIASSIHVYVKEKVPSIAVLHCLGASSKQSLMILLSQAAAMGLLGAFIGSTIGVSIQFLLPGILKDFIPVELTLTVSWSSIIYGLLISFSMSILFAMLPILKVKNISPLLAIRSQVSEIKTRSSMKWLIYFLIVMSVFIFAYFQAKTVWLAIGFTLFLILSFACLFLTAKLTILVIKKLFPKTWPYPIRQSLLNLFRPNNQTVTMITAIGLGVFLISTMYLTQESLFNFIVLAEDGNRPNIVMFDIQSDQKKGVREILKKNQLNGIKNYPIITMRLSSINGQKIKTILNDSNRKIPRWALTREYRSTYRKELSISEELIDGHFQEKVENPDDSIFVSIEDGILKRLELSMGDELVFNIQGIDFKTYIGSIRKVEWRRVQPNFFFVFPDGLLNDAPQVHVMTARVQDKKISADVQRDIVKAYPNVSAIDLSLIIEIVDNIIDKIAYVIRFMALFSILTGITVLIGAVISSRYQRSKENILLRTLGAKQKQIKTILFGEYFFLGTLSALTGLFLSIFSTYLLTHFIFKTNFNPNFYPFLITFTAVIVLILVIGVGLNRKVLKHSPLEILRQEAG